MVRRVDSNRPPLRAIDMSTPGQWEGAVDEMTLSGRSSTVGYGTLR